MLRREWSSELCLLSATAAAVTLVFAVTPLDSMAARVFYRTQAPDHWPLGMLRPWSILYRLPPFMTASLLAIGLLALLIGHLRKCERWRQSGVFLIVCVVIGPGLLVNTVFKDHWDRPRPRDVMEFGGSLHYTPAPWRGEGGGSFPCGHCSVGFLYAGGWWIWRRRRPRLARASLALGLTAGVALGLGRMAAGGHFLSDVIWSGLLAFGVAHLLYYHVLHLAEEDPGHDAPVRRPAWLPGARVLTVLCVLGAAFVLVALFITPHGKRFALQIDLERFAPQPRVFEIVARTANVDLVIVDAPDSKIRADGELHGFGLPGSRLENTTEFHPSPVPTVIFRIEEDGWITDLSAAATVRVPASALQRIVVELRQGNIRVTDRSRRRLVGRGAIRLDLHTRSGQVSGPPP